MAFTTFLAKPLWSRIAYSFIENTLHKLFLYSCFMESNQLPHLRECDQNLQQAYMKVHSKPWKSLQLMWAVLGVITIWKILTIHYCLLWYVINTATRASSNVVFEGSIWFTFSTIKSSKLQSTTRRSVLGTTSLRIRFLSFPSLPVSDFDWRSNFLFWRFSFRFCLHK